ncbi:MAG TPA: acetyl-CoA carboxylase biotin carboxyl carrier protein subunit [Daejeonella sp.]
MFKVKVNDQFNFELLFEGGKTFVNGNPVDLDLLQLSKTSLHVLYHNRSFNAELVEINREEKTCSVRVNSNIYKMSLTDQFDELLHKLGMDTMNSAKIAELKAPMPGMVLKILVEEGQEVKKGENLLVLEAMKMENIIKSPADVSIRSIKVLPSDKVEKNQVMIIFN